MIEYELINPSDKIYFQAPNFRAATMATAIVGNGAYAARANVADSDVPLFMFGGFKEFCEKNFGKIPDVNDVEFNKDLYATLISFRTEKERTSLNDICGYAHSYAEKVKRALSKMEVVNEP